MSRIPGTRPRWHAIDASRGVAMLFVCLSHFGFTYFHAEDPRRIWIDAVGMIASPTFLLISGGVVGFLAALRPERMPGLRRVLLDRALFLLTIGRVAILAAHIPVAGTVRAVETWEFITDTIAVCMLAGPPLVARVTTRSRVAIAFAGYAMCWSLVIEWDAPAGASAALKELLVGSPRLHALSYVFPLGPWFSLYLLATALGEKAGALHRRHGPAGVARATAVIGGAGVLAGAVGMLARSVVRHHGDGGRLAQTFVLLTDIRSKLPPGPLYLAFYGGVGLVLTAALMELERRGGMPAARAVAAMVGRNSLFTFIVQYAVYYTGVILLAPRPSAAWPAWLAGTLAAVLIAVFAWDRVEGTRYLTVGLARRRASPQPTVPAA